MTVGHAPQADFYTVSKISPGYLRSASRPLPRLDVAAS
jgi:hypothetical protein